MYLHKWAIASHTCSYKYRIALRMGKRFFFLHSDVTGNEGGITSSFFFLVKEQTSWRKNEEKTMNKGT
jgi:hypothetical protein